jgi:hypothetical protein
MSVTIKAICRDLGVSRKVVRKVIRSGSTEFRYHREEQPLPKIGRWREALDHLLLANEAVSRERLTLIRIYEELRSCGYDGSYDAVRRYARRWAKDRGQATAAAYVPLSFAPGEAYQFDWRHEVVLLSGVTVIVKVAHVRLCHSRMLSCGPIRVRRRRWCSTPMIGRSPCSKAPAGAASRQHEHRGRDDLRRQGQALQSPLPADVQSSKVHLPRMPRESFTVVGSSMI